MGDPALRNECLAWSSGEGCLGEMMSERKEEHEDLGGKEKGCNLEGQGEEWVCVDAG